MVAATSPTPDTTSFKAEAVSFAILVPLSTAWSAPSIRAEVFFEASADLAARFLTSSATTANPLPAAPALAASTAAFKDSILVWNAISSMVLMILPISPEVLLISSMAESISCIRLPLSSACSLTCSELVLASSAFFAFCSMLFDISLMVAACSVAPCERACAPEDTWSEPAET